MKLILIDFDRVLHSYTSGWQGADVIPDPPIPGAIDWLKTMIASPYLDVRIFSARCNDPKGVEAMRTWLLDNGLSALFLRHLQFEPGKPKAHLIIDDRALQFEGEYPQPWAVESFEPWCPKRGSTIFTKLKV